MKDPVRKNPHAVARASKVVKGSDDSHVVNERNWVSLDSSWGRSSFRIVRNK
jgi:hypothetical protein